MSDYELFQGNDNCNHIEFALRRLVGHPVVLHLVNGRTFRGLVLNVTPHAVRLISLDGCRTLIPLLHISAVREPQLSFTTRCAGRGDGVGGCDNDDD